jgi:hypothetical protein
MIYDLYAELQQKAPDYINFVQSLPSAATGHYGCVAHHRIGGRYSQRKVSDFETMPLLDPEHVELHAGLADFEERYGTTEAAMILKTLLTAIRLGVFKYDAKAARELGKEMRST